MAPAKPGEEGLSRGAGPSCRLPDLRVCFAHGGGAFPGTLGRIQHGFDVRPDLCAGACAERVQLALVLSETHGLTPSPRALPGPSAVDCPTSPTAQLGRFWADSLVHDEAALQLGVDLFGAHWRLYALDVAVHWLCMSSVQAKTRCASGPTTRSRSEVRQPPPLSDYAMLPQCIRWRAIPTLSAEFTAASGGTEYDAGALIDRMPGWGDDLKAQVGAPRLVGALSACALAACRCRFLEAMPSSGWAPTLRGSRGTTARAQRGYSLGVCTSLSFIL